MSRPPPASDESACSFDWQLFVFESKAGWIDRLTRLANRRFTDRTTAEEAFNFALNRVSSDNWCLLSNYSGKSSPGTYLAAVFNNALQDYSRARFGRPRPPAWLTKLGDLWTRVYRMLCLERMEPETIVDWLSARGERDPEQIRELICVIRARICNCGQVRSELELADPPGQPCQQQSATDTPDSLLEKQELAALLETLSTLLEKSEAVMSSSHLSGQQALTLAGEIRQRSSELAKAIELSDQERLILRQVYQEGRKIAAVARALGLPEHQARRTCKRVVKRLRNNLQKAGIDADFIRGIASE